MQGSRHILGGQKGAVNEARDRGPLLPIAKTHGDHSILVQMPHVDDAARKAGVVKRQALKGAATVAGPGRVGRSEDHDLSAQGRQRERALERQSEALDHGRCLGRDLDGEQRAAFRESENPGARERDGSPTLMAAGERQSSERLAGVVGVEREPLVARAQDHLAIVLLDVGQRVGSRRAPGCETPGISEEETTGPVKDTAGPG